jgi:Domain of unknown function (DUF1990)
MNDPWWKKRLTELDNLPYNYDASSYVQGQPGWNVDHYECELPQESPGKPVPGGSFFTAQKYLIAYKFPDPRRVVGYFNDASKLHDRTMLLHARFLGFKFEFGVRVSQVIDEVKMTESGEPMTRFGYAYRTLQDHWEIGEITYVISKNHVTGKVLFTIDAYSKADRIPNWFYRIGFRIFGRLLQKQFAKRSMMRLNELVRNELHAPTQAV